MTKKGSRKKELTEEEFIREFDTKVYRECLLHGAWSDVADLYPSVGDTIVPVVMRILVNEVRRKGGPMEEIVLSEETKAVLDKRAADGCVSCAYITSDFQKNGKLTDYPGNYPVEAKIAHVNAEREGWVK